MENKKKWYKTNLGVILLLGLLFPVGLFYMWKDTNWKPKMKWSITAIFIFFIFSFNILANLKADRVSSQRQAITIPTPKPTAVPTAASTLTVTPTPSPSPTPTPNPTPIEQLKTQIQTPQPSLTSTSKPQEKNPEQILTEIVKKYKANDNDLVMEESGEWYIVKQAVLDGDFGMFTLSKQFTRDLIFELYATKLPIRSVAVSIQNNSSSKYYRVKLSKDMADTQSPDTWTDKNVGPSIFYDFLKQATNGYSGDGKNSTYVETNLD